MDLQIEANDLGNITRHKVHLDANGMRQQDGIEFAKTFALVIKSSTIRLILSIVVMKKWEPKQLDVTNANLHGGLEETVYMHQPLGFCDKERPNYVYRLLRSIYGLKQSSHAWFHRLHDYLVELGFQEGIFDQSLFVYKFFDVMLFFLVYVNNIVIASSSPTFINKTIGSLKEVFCN